MIRQPCALGLEYVHVISHGVHMFREHVHVIGQRHVHGHATVCTWSAKACTRSADRVHMVGHGMHVSSEGVHMIWPSRGRDPSMVYGVTRRCAHGLAIP